MVEIVEKGRWSESGVVTRWQESGFAPPADVRERIEEEWRRQKERLGEKLFDGPMCRLESMGRNGSVLELGLSRTSYKAFVGTNLHHAELGDSHGEKALANPVGVSCALLSADGYLMMGRRNERVAYYPNRVHPFAGTLEPQGEGLPDVFAEVRRELKEELALGPGDVKEIVCAGVVKDLKLRQPELMFVGWAKLSRREIEGRLDEKEHVALVGVLAHGEGLSKALETVGEMTPVAVAAVVLCGRQVCGERWYGSVRRHYQDRSER